MADPDVQSLPKDTWTKVATNVTTGFIHIINIKPGVYMQTYRDTGGSAPTLKTEGVPMKRTEPISNTTGIDVYVYPIAKAGLIRVDL